MSHAAHATNAHEDLGWNPEDPHGINPHAHHGHIVVGWKLQLGVLLALIFLTVLTVAFYNAEQWAETAFGITLPGWVNIVGAMTIATIKATLVCMYFMQLRYDKALNTFALLFCLFAVGLFLFFSIIDLSTRGWVTEFKQGEIVAGGTGVGLDSPPIDDAFNTRVSPRITTAGVSIATFRRNQEMQSWLEARPDKEEKDFWKYFYAKAYKPVRHPDDEQNYFSQLAFDRDPDALSTPNRSVPRYGRTDALDPNPSSD